MGWRDAPVVEAGGWQSAPLVDDPKERVIATTPDGGRVVKGASGKLSFTSPGFATSDPDKIAKIMEGATPVDLVQSDLDNERIAANPISARGQELINGVPFVGEFADEAVGLVHPQAGENMRALSDAMEREKPGQSLALNVTGGIAGSVPLAVAGAGMALERSTRLGRVSTGAGLGLAAGAAEGASSEAGRADPGKRLEEAQMGALRGAAIGTVLGALAPLIGEGATAVARRVKKLDVRTIMDEFGLSAPAARTLRASLANDDLDAAAAQIARIGDDAMLADAGDATRQTLDTAMATGGEALRIARTRVDSRAAQSGVRLSKALDNILGPADGVKAAARDISKRTAQARGQAYDRAYAQAINYASSAGRKIEEVFSRIPPGTLQSAIKEANEAMQAKGMKNMQIMAQIADDGSVVFSEMPNVQQLDFIKRALGEVAEGNKDQFGRLNGAGLRANQLAGQLRDALGEAVPAYSRAVRLGGDKIAEDRALDMGRRLLSRATTYEDARDVLAKASREAKLAAQRGLREQIEDTLSNVKRTISDPNTDAREAMALVKEMSSRANMRKARLVLGSEAQTLFRELEKAEAALALRAAVSRNSATAIRLAGQDAVKAEVEPGLIRRTLGRGGNPLEGAQQVTEAIAGIDPRSMNQAEQAIFAEIADTLTGLRGAEAEKALRIVNRAMKGQAIKDAEADLIGRVVAGAVAGSGYQAVEQVQGR